MIKNNRQSPRIEINLPAEVINGSGKIITAHLVNLSIDGLSLCGDLAFIDHIEEKDQTTGEPVFPIEVSVSFQVATDEGNAPVMVQARRVHKRRQSENEYQCGFTIFQFENDGHEQVRTFIQTAIDAQTARSSGMLYIPN